MIYKYFTYMARMKNNETVMTLAVSNSDSLRTTVPIHIVKKLKLEKGVHVEWDLDKVNNKWVATVQKKEA